VPRKINVKEVAKDILRERGELTVEELVNEIAKQHRVSLWNASFEVLRAYLKGELDLEDPKPPTSFTKYVFSTYTTWFWLLIAFVASTLTIVFTVTENSPLIILRYILGTLYVLYIPGATLIEALYPKHEGLSSLERLALSIGLSLALVPLVGLILNYTPWGIRLTPIATSLATLSIALATIAVYRKYHYHKLKITGKTS